MDLLLPSHTQTSEASRERKGKEKFVLLLRLCVRVKKRSTPRARAHVGCGCFLWLPTNRKRTRSFGRLVTREKETAKTTARGLNASRLCPLSFSLSARRISFPTASERKSRAVSNGKDILALRKRRTKRKRKQNESPDKDDQRFKGHLWLSGIR